MAEVGHSICPPHVKLLECSVILSRCDSPNWRNDAVVSSPSPIQDCSNSSNYLKKKTPQQSLPSGSDSSSGSKPDVKIEVVTDISLQTAKQERSRRSVNRRNLSNVKMRDVLQTARGASTEAEKLTGHPDQLSFHFESSMAAEDELETDRNVSNYDSSLPLKSARTSQGLNSPQSYSSIESAKKVLKRKAKPYSQNLSPNSARQNEAIRTHCSNEIGLPPHYHRDVKDLTDIEDASHTTNAENALEKNISGFIKSLQLRRSSRTRGLKKSGTIPGDLPRKDPQTSRITTEDCSDTMNYQPKRRRGHYEANVFAPWSENMVMPPVKLVINVGVGFPFTPREVHFAHSCLNKEFKSLSAQFAELCASVIKTSCHAESSCRKLLMPVHEPTILKLMENKWKSRVPLFLTTIENVNERPSTGNESEKPNLMSNNIVEKYEHKTTSLSVSVNLSLDNEEQCVISSAGGDKLQSHFEDCGPAKSFIEELEEKDGVTIDVGLMKMDDSTNLQTYDTTTQLIDMSSNSELLLSATSDSSIEHGVQSFSPTECSEKDSNSHITSQKSPDKFTAGNNVGSNPQNSILARDKIKELCENASRRGSHIDPDDSTRNVIAESEKKYPTIQYDPDDTRGHEVSNVQAHEFSRTWHGKSKVSQELRRLNVALFDVSDPLGSMKCRSLEFCRLGCVCQSLSGQVIRDHCGNLSCMFKCSCVNARRITVDRTTPFAWMQEKAKENLAREEKQFKLTAVRSGNDNFVLVENKRKREIKLPGRYRDDFVVAEKDVGFRLKSQALKAAKKCSVPLVTMPTKIPLLSVNKQTSPTKTVLNSDVPILPSPILPDIPMSFDDSLIEKKQYISTLSGGNLNVLRSRARQRRDLLKRSRLWKKTFGTFRNRAEWDILKSAKRGKNLFESVPSVGGPTVSQITRPFFRKVIRPCSVLLDAGAVDKYLARHKVVDICFSHKVAMKSTSKVNHTHNIMLNCARTVSYALKVKNKWSVLGQSSNSVEEKPVSVALQSCESLNDTDVSEVALQISSVQSLPQELWDESLDECTEEQQVHVDSSIFMNYLNDRKEGDVVLLPSNLLRDEAVTGKIFLWLKVNNPKGKRRIYLSQGPEEPCNDCLDVRSIPATSDYFHSIPLNIRTLSPECGENINECDNSMWIAKLTKHKWMLVGFIQPGESGKRKDFNTAGVTVCADNTVPNDAVPSGVTVCVDNTVRNDAVPSGVTVCADNTVPNDAVPSGVTVCADNTVPNDAVPSGVTVCVDNTVPNDAVPSGVTVYVDNTVPNDTVPSEVSVCADDTVPNVAVPSEVSVCADDTVPNVAVPSAPQAPYRWWLMEISNTYDLIHFIDYNMMVTRGRLATLAHLSNLESSYQKIHRILITNGNSSSNAPRGPDFGIYGLPGMAKFVVIGPYGLTQEPKFNVYSNGEFLKRLPLICCGLKQSVMVNERGVLSSTIDHLPRDSVKGYWLHSSTCDNAGYLEDPGASLAADSSHGQNKSSTVTQGLNCTSVASDDYVTSDNITEGNGAQSPTSHTEEMIHSQLSNQNEPVLDPKQLLPTNSLNVKKKYLVSAIKELGYITVSLFPNNTLSIEHLLKPGLLQLYTSILDVMTEVNDLIHSNIAAKSVRCNSGGDNSFRCSCVKWECVTSLRCFKSIPPLNCDVFHGYFIFTSKGLFDVREFSIEDINQLGDDWDDWLSRGKNRIQFKDWQKKMKEEKVLYWCEKLGVLLRGHDQSVKLPAYDIVEMAKAEIAKLKAEDHLLCLEKRTQKLLQKSLISSLYYKLHGVPVKMDDHDANIIGKEDSSAGSNGPSVAHIFKECMVTLNRKKLDQLNSQRLLKPKDMITHNRRNGLVHCIAPFSRLNVSVEESGIVHTSPARMSSGVSGKNRVERRNGDGHSNSILQVAPKKSSVSALRRNSNASEKSSGLSKPPVVDVDVSEFHLQTPVDSQLGKENNECVLDDRSSQIESSLSPNSLMIDKSVGLHDNEPLLSGTGTNQVDDGIPVLVELLNGQSTPVNVKVPTSMLVISSSQGPTISTCSPESSACSNSSSISLSKTLRNSSGTSSVVAQETPSRGSLAVGEQSAEDMCNKEVEVQKQNPQYSSILTMSIDDNVGGPSHCPEIFSTETETVEGNITFSFQSTSTPADDSILASSQEKQETGFDICSTPPSVKTKSVESDSFFSTVSLNHTLMPAQLSAASSNTAVIHNPSSTNIESPLQLQITDVSSLSLGNQVHQAVEVSPKEIRPSSFCKIPLSARGPRGPMLVKTLPVLSSGRLMLSCPDLRLPQGATVRLPGKLLSIGVTSIPKNSSLSQSSAAVASGTAAKPVYVLSAMNSRTSVSASTTSSTVPQPRGSEDPSVVPCSKIQFVKMNSLKVPVIKVPMVLSNTPIGKASLTSGNLLLNSKPTEGNRVKTLPIANSIEKLPKWPPTPDMLIPVTNGTASSTSDCLTFNSYILRANFGKLTSAVGSEELPTLPSTSDLGGTGSSPISCKIVIPTSQALADTHGCGEMKFLNTSPEAPESKGVKVISSQNFQTSSLKVETSKEIDQN